MIYSQCSFTVSTSEYACYNKENASMKVNEYSMKVTTPLTHTQFQYDQDKGVAMTINLQQPPSHVNTMHRYSAGVGGAGRNQSCLH